MCTFTFKTYRTIWKPNSTPNDAIDHAACHAMRDYIRTRDDRTKFNFFPFYRYNPPLFGQDPYLSVKLHADNFNFGRIFFLPVLVDLPSFLQFSIKFCT